MEGIAKATTFIVEILLSGFLVLLALAGLAYSLLPNEMSALLAQLNQSSLATTPTLLVPMLTAIAYALGILSDFIAVATFEGWLDRIKRVRLFSYLNAPDNQDFLAASPILKNYRGTTQPLAVRTASLLEGEMRYHVMMKNAKLYEDIESQISRLRVIRVLFYIELIVLLALILQMTRGVSLLLVLVAALDVTLIVANLYAIRFRFQRYCRSVERSYKVLRMEEIGQTSKPKSRKKNAS